MRPYFAILSARFRALLQYRAAALAGVGTQILFGLVLIMTYEAFFESTAIAQPISFSQIVSYVWLGQALLAMLPRNVDSEVRAMVRSGAVAYELCRPLDLYNLWFARAMAWRVAPTLLRAVPLVVLVTLLPPWIGLGEWQLRPPAPGFAGAFVAALASTFLLSAALTTLINITMMWTIANEGAVTLLTGLVPLLSGMIIPLPLLPEWVKPVVAALPFAGLVDSPFRIYVGNVPAESVPGMLARQAVWIVLLVALGRWLMGRGLRRLTVQGG